MSILPEILVSPPRTITGNGKILTLLNECRQYGKRGMLVHGRSLEVSGALKAVLESAPSDLDLKVCGHPGGEPTLEQVEAMLGAARNHKAKWVAAIGGGSVLDAAKACAGLLHADLPVEEYHNGAAIKPSAAPFIAVPTTAGTGSECTAVCVLTNLKTKIKRSFRHPSFMAQLVILDPELLKGCPPAVIANAGMDAFAQAVESYVSLGATWISDQYAIKAIELIPACLEAVYPGKREADRHGLLQGSFLAGLALANARLGLVHGIAHPLGALYNQPHGLVCAVCLRPVLEFNRPAIAHKYDAMSNAVGCDLIDKTRNLLNTLNIANPFSGHSVRNRKLIISETCGSGSTKANPRPVTEKDIDRLLADLFT